MDLQSCLAKKHEFNTLEPTSHRSSSLILAQMYTVILVNLGFLLQFIKET